MSGLGQAVGARLEKGGFWYTLSGGAHKDRNENEKLEQRSNNLRLGLADIEQRYGEYTGAARVGHEAAKQRLSKDQEAERLADEHAIASAYSTGRITTEREPDEFDLVSRQAAEKRMQERPQLANDFDQVELVR